MKNILSLVFMLAAFVALPASASNVYCPSSITCSAEGGVAHCSTNPPLGSTWKVMDQQVYSADYAGTYYFYSAGNAGEEAGWCNYKTGRTSPAAGYIYFKNINILYPDTKVEGNKWNSVAHGCTSAFPQDCPFTDSKS